ncbi:MAG: LVIVD repeat-containing protein, partial [Candidatus Baldrarchaeia archaeon]
VRKMLRRRVSLILLCLLLLMSFQPYIVTAEDQTEDQVESAPIQIRHYKGTDEFTLRVYSDGPTTSTPLLTTDIIVDNNCAYPLGLWSWTNSGIIYFDVNDLEGRAHIRRINPLTHEDYYRGNPNRPFSFHDPAFITFDVHDGNIYAVVFSADQYAEGTETRGPMYHYNVFGFAIWRKGEFSYTYIHPFKKNFNSEGVWFQDTPLGKFFIEYYKGLVFISVLNPYTDFVNNSYTMIFNVTDLSNVRLLANFSYSYFSYNFFNERILILIVEDYLYLAKMYGELEIRDISDPSNPAFVRSINFGSPIFDMKYDSKKKAVYVASGISGLKIFNVSNPSNPTLMQTYNSTLKCSFGVETIDENIVVVSDGVFGVHILNISNIKNIFEISSIKTNDRAYHVTYCMDKLLVGDMSGGLYVIDISNLKNPKTICSQIIIGSKMVHEYGIGALVSGSWDPPGTFLHFSAEKLWLYYANPEKDYSVGFNLDFHPSVLILYNDTDNNGKLTVRYVRNESNPSIIDCMEITDQVYCAGYIWGWEHRIPPSEWDVQKDTKEGINCIKATVQLKDIFLEHTSIFSSVNWLQGQGKANVLMTVWFIPKIINEDDNRILNVTVKIDFAIEFHDLELYSNPESFCVYLGFFASGWGGTYGGYPAYSIIEGHDMPKYSLIAAKEIGFVCANTNAIINENGKNRTQNIYISNDYFGTYLELTESSILGLNFHNITSNSKIYYDPRVNVWLNYRTPLIKKIITTIIVTIPIIATVILIRRKRKHQRIQRKYEQKFQSKEKLQLKKPQQIIFFF